MHVKQSINKWVQLVELDFQPSLRETRRPLPSDMGFDFSWRWRYLS